MKRYPIKHNTPVEEHEYSGIKYFVKREDLACKRPGPPFAKVRGLYPVLLNLQKEGVTTVAYMDTAISMAGWGISYFTSLLGMKSILYYPKYKGGFKYRQEAYLKLWEKYGATVIPIEKPQLLMINRNMAKKHLRENFPGAVMLPNGLAFPETVAEVAKEVESLRDLNIKTIVTCAGSGVMTAGILRGLALYELPKIDALISVRVHKEANMKKSFEKILKLAGVPKKGHLFCRGVSATVRNFTVISGGYLYEERPLIESPFPCNPYYDLKAFEYMCKNIHNLKPPVLFWNIGA